MIYFQKLRSLLDKKTKSRLLWLIFFSIIVSIIETIGISAIMPFIDVAINFDNIHSNSYYQWAFDFFGFEDKVNFAIAFGLVLIGFYLFRGGINLLYNYMMADFSQNLYAQITEKLFKTYLAMPYEIFTNKNSSYLTKTIVTEATLISTAVGAVLLMISEVFVITFLYLLMLLASWKITLIFTAILIIKMIFLTKTISKRIDTIGSNRAEVHAKFYEIINRVFGNFKQIKLQDKDKLKAIDNDFSVTVNQYAKINTTHTFLTSFPRIFLETVGFVLVVLLLVVLLYLNQSDVLYVLPTLSLFVLALYRLLPSVNRIVNSYNTLIYSDAAIDIINSELSTKKEYLKSEVVKFNHAIELKNIEFAYQNKRVLNDVSLTINKGEKIAFKGESGAGKSTLVDLMIGLYRPNKGEIRVDGIIIDESNLQNWRSSFGYIPQQVYLFDGTIAQNVCFGREFDNDLLKQVLKQANIYDFLQTKQGVDTLVGEGGVQLSGGQKQRVAIARALYGNPEILVLDEATSALDEDTEKKIMDEIYSISRDRTLIIIAHRLSTIKDCDRIYEIKDGLVKVTATKFG